MSVVAIIQGRMGSTRMPGKTLAPLQGRPLIEWVMRRTAAAKLVDKTVLATTDRDADDELAAFCTTLGFPVFRGSEEDVLERYARCAQLHGATTVVRVTADDPLKSPAVLDGAIERLRAAGADYCSNTLHPTYPEGLDIEVFTHEALQRAYAEARLPSEREHVTPYIWKHPERFRIVEMNMAPNLSAWRWTVDHDADLRFVETLLKASGAGIDVDVSDLISLVQNSKELLDMCTNKVVRNEGYLKSLSREEGMS